MTKHPPIVYAYDNNGLTGESAYLWVLFLMREAQLQGNTEDFNKWKDLAKSMRPSKKSPPPSSVFNSDLMDAIDEYLI
tara:strand:+ start:2725 stop:2958 length:234 start_codon:yes stop_codon:yes gene_type:complete